MTLLDRVHGERVAPRRVRVLCEQLAPLLPRSARVLDVGCGDGTIARRIMDLRTDLEMEGVDVLVRDRTQIPVRAFDGAVIPSESGAFEAVLLIDVLHHADRPLALLREAARVSRRFVIIKDHQVVGHLAVPTLRFMDWVGNARYGVALPYTYYSPRQWQAAFLDASLRVDVWKEKLHLYPPPSRWIFERGLHFLARLSRGGGS